MTLTTLGDRLIMSVNGSKSPTSLARFPNLQKHRTELGWEVSDLVAKMPDGRPKEASIRRLEKGRGIRASSVHRVFDVVNRSLGGKLDRTQEIVPGA